MFRAPFLFCPGGGIGDSIVSLPTLDFLIKYVAPNAVIDVILGSPREIYKDIIGDRQEHIRYYWEKEIPHTIGPYWGSLSANEFCNFQMSYRFTKLMEEREPEFMALIREGSQRIASLGDCTRSFPMTGQNEIANNAVKMGLSRNTLPLWSMGLNPPYPLSELNLSLFPKIVPGRYITINDGWAGDSPNRLTKSWNETGWIEFVRLCREDDICVVQLGGKSNGIDVPGIHFSFRGTDFKTSLSILKHSECHVDIEGGLVHAAAALGVPSVVLFGPTNVDFFAYPDNFNLLSGTCQNCWWTKPDWMNKCPKTNHICMNHAPQAVFEAVKTILGRKNNG